MPRPPDRNRRRSLQEAVVEYVLTHGISDLSLRPVAEALGVSTYSLAYHFGSKEGLIAAVMSHIEERERRMTATWMAEPGAASTPGAILRRYWREWCLPPELAPYHRLFYEIYALSLQQPERFPGFLERGARPWLPLLQKLAQRAGARDSEADLLASVMVSAILGALLLLLGTGDAEAATRAVDEMADHVERLTARWQSSATTSNN